MTEQRDIWKKCRVKCIALHSESEDDLSIITKEHFTVMFISPELVLSDNFRSQMNAKTKECVCLIAVDEAHCISDWGFFTISTSVRTPGRPVRSHNETACTHYDSYANYCYATTNNVIFEHRQV